MFQPSGGSAGVEQEAEHLLAVGVLDVSPEVANAAMWHNYDALDERGTGRGAKELDLMNVSRILALGGSICRVLRGYELPGGPVSNQPVPPGGSAKEGPHVRGESELGSYELRSELEVELGSDEFK